MNARWIFVLVCAALANTPPHAAVPEGLKGKVYFIKPSNVLPDFGRLEPALIIYTNPIQAIDFLSAALKPRYAVDKNHH